MRSLFLLMSAACLTGVAPAAAQSYPARGFSTLRYRPPVGVHNYLSVESARLTRPRDGSFGAYLEWAGEPLHTDDPCAAIAGVDRAVTECRETALIEHAGFLHLSGGVAVHERVFLALSVPLGVTSAKLVDGAYLPGTGGGSFDRSLEIEAAEGFVLADPRLLAKIRLTDERLQPLHLAVAIHATLPVASAFDGDCDERRGCHFAGERTTQAGLDLLSEFAVGRFSAAANLGFTFRPNAAFLTEKVGSEVRYGGAARYRPLAALGLVAELVGVVSVTNGGAHPAELRGGVQLGKRDVTVTLAGGYGVLQGPGVPRVHVFGGLNWTPLHADEDGDGLEDQDDACPGDPEDLDGFMDGDGCPELDNDEDGLPDDKDACPGEPEDVDGFRDEDGCPDPDNDGDGVPDGYDSCAAEKEDMDGDRDGDGCPDLDTDRDGINDDADACKNEPEDRDGLGDEDGCPDPDFDGDGLLDEQDLCPEQAENFNGLEDEDGCPEPDRDGDGVPDPQDRCLNRSETLNGRADTDGCPDGPAHVVLQGRLLLPTYQPAFKPGSATLHRRRTFAVLDTVAAVIARVHRKGQVRVVAVAPASDTLALARAQAVADYLASKGVPSARLESARLEGAPARIELILEAPGQPAPAP